MNGKPASLKGYRDLFNNEPLKIFEYMASGKAIVCSDLPVLREVLTHEVSALLCDPLKPEEWEKALKRLEADLGLRSTLGETAKRVHANLYTWKARVDRIFVHIVKIK